MCEFYSNSLLLFDSFFKISTSQLATSVSSYTVNSINQLDESEPTDDDFVAVNGLCST